VVVDEEVPRVPEYESFNAAETALANFAGWETERGIRPMTPKERADAQQLLKDRRADITERGKQGIEIMRKGVRERGQNLVSRYTAGLQLFDNLDEDIEDGMSVQELESALSDAAMLQRELGKQADAHLSAVADVERDQDPEKFMRSLYQRFPSLRRDGRVSPWNFGW
jgi:hypothetical protein